MTNDRFRFRVWDKNGDSYISEKDDADFLYLGENGKLTIGLYNDDADDITCLKEKDLIIEQCTGLKDKNGRLIYEGDIIKITGDVMTIPIFYEESKAFVNWDEDGFFLHFESGTIERLFQECCDYEVVGNLHENPELLED